MTNSSGIFQFDDDIYNDICVANEHVARDLSIKKNGPVYVYMTQKASLRGPSHM